MTELVDASTGTVTRQSFDAWGNKRDVSDWTIPATYNLFADRGFTGHEHLEEFELINMNGRVYDPALGRFLSPDPYVQMPDFSQSFNRYSYCLNNPLVYTDPSGEIIFTILASILCPALLPVAIAADIGGNLNVIFHAGKIENFKQLAGYYGIGAASSAVGAGVGLGVSSALAGGSFFGGVMGTSTVVSTGFTAGFVSGATGGFSGGFINGFGNAAMNPDNDFKDMLNAGFDSGWKAGLLGGVAEGIAGGIDALRHDRNFWTGSGKQNVVVKVNTHGNGEFMPENDYNAPYTSQQTRDYYQTHLPNKGVVSIKTPNNVDRITGMNVPEKTLITMIERSKNVLTFNTDKASYVILHGWRYHSNPVTSIKDLFHWRPRFK